MAEEPEHPIQVKAKGKKLITKSRRLLDNIPPEFRAEAVVRVEKQAVPTETEINDPLQTNQMGSSVEADNTTQSQKIDEFLDQDLPVVLVDSVITPVGQLGVRTRTLDEGIQTLTPDPVQIEGNVNNIGADRSIKTTIVVPEVFPADLYAKERPEVIPERFRAAVPLTTTRLDSEGEAAPPTLLPGDVSRSSEQTREGVVRETDAIRDTTSLPVTLTGQEQTWEGQIAAVTETLDDTVQTITSSPTQVDASVENLGNDLTLKTTKVVPVVFPSNLYSKERPEVLPPKFRAALPATTTRIDTAGTAAMPTLVPGDVVRSSEQTRVDVKRDTVTVRDLASPPTLVGQVTTTEFGGDVATVAESVVADGTAADSGVGVVSSEVDTLGDGSSVKRTVARTSGAWPTLLDFEFDERLKQFTRIEKTVVPVASATTPSISGGTTTEFKGLDKWRSVQIVSRFDLGVIGLSTTRRVTGKYSFPDTIVRCAFVPALVSVGSEYSFSLSLDVDIKDGPSGAFPGRLVEDVVSNPNTTLPSIFQYKTTHGTISIAYVYGVFALIGGRLAATANSQTWSIPPSLHSALNPSLTGTAGIVVTDGDGVGPSDPTALNSGDEILIDVGVDAWRFNTYIISKLYITVPTLA